MLQVIACFQKWKKFWKLYLPASEMLQIQGIKPLINNYVMIKYLIDYSLCYYNQGIVGKAKCLKKIGQSLLKINRNSPKTDFFHTKVNFEAL